MVLRAFCGSSYFLQMCIVVQKSRVLPETEIFSSKFAVIPCKKAKSFIYTLSAGASQEVPVQCFTLMAVYSGFSERYCHHIIPKAENKTFSTLSAQAQICYFYVLVQAYLCAKSFSVFNLLSWLTIFSISGGCLLSDLFFLPRTSYF